MRKKVLVADDDRDIVRTLTDLLEAKGYEVISAYEGVRTVELTHKEKPDLIILDWKMPAGKGSMVLESLAGRKDTKSIPVIVLSGTDEAGMEECIKKFGVRIFMRKPYEPHELLQKISEILQWKIV